MTSPRANARARLRRVAPFLLLASLPSCAGAPPPVRYYEIVVSGERKPPIAHGPTLAIGPLETDAAYDTDRVVYRMSPYRLDYYNYHRWGAYPGL